mmetsp:Transcript_64172/g.137834  ORF Transcript_64172/g.137834 Transcript_64172/m.137834 type:complete len:122 (-) Transcript_64172:143-508(-)
MASALHMVARAFNSLDYVLIGVLTAMAALCFFTPLYRQANSSAGRLALFGVVAYFYITWQLHATQIPAKSAEPNDAEKVAFFRATRDVYLEYGCLVLALAALAISKLRGDIAALEERQKQL